MSEANPRDRAEHALRQATRASKAGDLKAAQHWTKLAEQLSAAAERVAALPASDPYEGEEERRAELRRRLMLFAQADNDLDRWEKERAIYNANIEAALANALDPPEPLRPNPAGNLSQEDYLAGIAKGEIK